MATTESSTEQSPSSLGVRGAPPPGSLGGPLVALASARPAGSVGADSRPGEPSSTSRPRIIDTAGRAVVRILVSPADGRSPGAGGLGFLVDGRGYVLTHDRLIRDAKGLEVVLADGRKAPVKQVWRDQLAGVAVLKIEGSGLPALPLGESGALRVGDAAIIVGWPSATQTPTARAAIRATGAATGGNLAIDAPIATEYAGSPLVDVRGQVVGIATTEGSVMDASSPGGFAIPIDRAKSMLGQARSPAAQSRPGTPPTR